MQDVYEALIEWVEQREVTEASDRVIQHLGEEMTNRRRRGALDEAARLLVERPKSDPSPLARYHRLRGAGNLPAARVDEALTRFTDLFLREMRKRIDVAA